MLGLTTQDTDDDLGDLVRELLDGAEWSVSVRGTWAFARPTGVQLPLQGWKLHVSATSAGATEVVRRCVEVLAGGRTPFKVARSTTVVAEVTGSHADRAQAGKVVTIYPGDDATFLQLAEALTDATDGLPGPRILTDRPVRSGAIVHYRYGAFTGIPMFAPNGMLTAGLRTPDGTVVSDPREARFTPPAWAPDPFGPVPERTTDGLLAGRYAVAGAIRHAARGGVFRATDTSTGRPVVVKHARCHIDEARPGHDARARLRHEADVLAGLAGLPGVPELVDVFEQEGDLFLVETDLGGESLSAWVATHPDAPTRSILRVLAALALLVDRFHDRGLVLRDLSPNNVIVGADGTVGIVDLETVLRPGEDPRLCRGATQAYAAPEAPSDEPPSQAVDAFSLGAVIAFALTGEHPLLDDELPSVRTWLDVAGRRLRMPAAVAELVDQLCAQDPARRPRAATTATRLAALARADVSRPASRRAVEAALEPTHAPLAGSALDEAIAALTSQLVRSLRVEDQDAAVDSSSVGRLTSPTNVHHGSAGVILALARHVATTPDADLSQTLRDLTAWTARRARDLPSGLPVGMSFGGAGTAYALSVAADALLDPALTTGAVEDVLLLPTDGAAFDVTHGTAGLGLALVHLWDRTADRRLTDRIVEVTRSLAACSVRDARGLGWPTGANGSRGVGFAHGLAGVAALMQCVANRFDLADARQLADEAVATLVREAVVVDDCARWRLDLSDRPTTASWWCHGTGGVIVPLVRAPAGTVKPDLLRACGRALVADRRQVGLSYCHGLAGSAEALLDLDESLPGEGWGVRAAELLALAWSRRRECPDGSLRLGDPVVGSVPDFGVGQAGLLSVMLRLRDGGPRALVPFDGPDR
jgi:serine/threonine protein kinase